MFDEKRYVRSIYRQAVVMSSIAAILAAGFITFAFVSALLGNRDYLKDGLFNFCLFALPFMAAFIIAVRVIHGIVQHRIDWKRRREEARTSK